MRVIEFNEDKQNLKVQTLYKQEEEELAQLLSQRYGIPYIDLSAVPINTDALRLINEKEARENKVAAFGILGKKVQVAVFAPKRDETKAIIKALEDKNYIVTEFMASTASLDKAWDRYKDLSFAFETKAGSLDISSEEIESFIGKVQTVADINKLIEEALSLKKTYRTSKLLAIIAAGALSTKASDIHIEPEEEYAGIRYRLDGVLIPIIKFDKESYGQLLSRIKLLSGLKLNIKETAQDGRFSIKIYQDDIEIRTSVLPGAYGESIVMRILNPKSIMVSMEDLGIPEKLLKILQHEIGRPNGMILTTGPTGSGKTTSLYSFLRKVHSPEIKIITIEDPIEYHLPGIVQTQVDAKKGYTFASGLRSALRQDPDVIMVGEIRDEETAEIAINAALTGHLVFSTLHTNNAAGAFPRLMDLGINPKVITSSITLALAQRLVRKLCQECKKEIPLPEDRRKIVEEILASIPEDQKYKGDIHVYQGTGCAACNGTGFKGRIGIYEAIRTDQAVEQIILDNPSEREIRKAARAQGILTMAQDGIVKSLTGVTSLDELERVVDLESEVDYSEPKEKENPPTDIPLEDPLLQSTNL
jgi:type II secretory ATPase GspE/PulE/Tfp pilus assembly ATPase PilB-like protein